MRHLFHRRGRASRQDSPGRTRPGPRQMAWEPLEVRALLATLNIASEALSFNSTSTIPDDLSIATTGPTGNYTITDSSTTITLQGGAIAAGWKGSGTHTVTGPDASVTSIAVNTREGSDSVDSADAPVALTFTSVTANVDSVTIGGDSKKGCRPSTARCRSKTSPARPI